MSLHALHLQAPAPWSGARFALHHAPAGSARGGLLYLHPLAEEMNKARRMAARQAQRLAQAGWHVLLLDRLGCGDSDGDSADMSWPAWQADVRLGLEWLRQQTGGPLWLWGLRAGCLLAAEAAAAMVPVAQNGLACQGLLLWQPQASGKLAAQQFLRLRLAADMLAGQAKGASEALRQSLDAGQVVSVAGYGVQAALINGLEKAQLQAPQAGMRVVWLELGAEGAPLSPASQRVADDWRSKGIAVQARVVPGPMFWQTTEIEDAPALWQASDEALREAA